MPMALLVHPCFGSGVEPRFRVGVRVAYIHPSNRRTSTAPMMAIATVSQIIRRLARRSCSLACSNRSSARRLSSGVMCGFYSRGRPIKGGAQKEPPISSPTLVDLGGTHRGRPTKLGANRVPSSIAPATLADLGLTTREAFAPSGEETISLVSEVA